MLTRLKNNARQTARGCLLIGELWVAEKIAKRRYNNTLDNNRKRGKFAQLTTPQHAEYNGINKLFWKSWNRRYCRKVHKAEDFAMQFRDNYSVDNERLNRMNKLLETLKNDNNLCQSL